MLLEGIEAFYKLCVPSIPFLYGGRLSIISWFISLEKLLSNHKLRVQFLGIKVVIAFDSYNPVIRCIVMYREPLLPGCLCRIDCSL